jgi:catechol 2,3-dioxygenase-like lactoylglutathione lyase family enzyme
MGVLDGSAGAAVYASIARRHEWRDTDAMYRMIALALGSLLVGIPASTASAQILAAKDGPIVYGHHHLNATSIDEHKKFWVDALGGTAIKAGTFDVITFPNVLIFLSARMPGGPTKGSSLNHIGFSVPDLRRVVDNVKANGFRMVTAEEAPAGVTVKDDIGVTGSGIAYALGPDGVKVELLQVDGQSAPIVHHHIHFFGDRPDEMRAWYMKVFGAKLRQTQINGIIGADLPAGGLNFSQSTGPVTGTRGRALDHIGFEVRNLEEFC